MVWTKEELVKVWERFCEGRDYHLVDKKEFLDALAEGVLANEKTHGYKFCPCRVRDGTRKQDLDLLCPCNFKSQQKWKEKGECWCGLFVKRG